MPKPDRMSKPDRAKILAALSGFVALATISTIACSWERIVAHYEPKPGILGVEIESPGQPIPAQGEFTIKPKLTNRSSERITIVLPGDGSRWRWRTPFVGWSILPGKDRTEHPAAPPQTVGGRCGNINSLKSSEIVALAPGQSVTLGAWAGTPRFPGPGEYRVVFYYTNEPGASWKGLGTHDPEAMQLVSNSTRCAGRSNELLVTVGP